MIEYSVFMMKNPIKPKEAPKAYAKNQVREIWDLDKFCTRDSSSAALWPMRPATPSVSPSTAGYSGHPTT